MPDRGADAVNKTTRFYVGLECMGVVFLALVWGWAKLYGVLWNAWLRLRGRPPEFDTPTDGFDS